VAHPPLVVILDSVVEAGPDQFGSPANEAALNKVLDYHGYSLGRIKKNIQKLE